MAKNVLIATVLVGIIGIAFMSLRMVDQPCPLGPLADSYNCRKDQTLLWVGKSWYQSVTEGPLKTDVERQLDSSSIKFELSDFGRARDLVLQKEPCTAYTGSDTGVCFVGEHSARGKHFHLLFLDDLKKASYFHGYWRKLSENQWVQIPR